MELNFKVIKSAFPRTIPILCGYIFLGMGFGVLLSKSGYSFLWATFSSVIVFAGSMQYVEVDLLNSSFNLLNAVIITLAVNIRHVFYGLSLIEKYKDLGKYKFYCMFGLTDETYSLVCSQTIPKSINKPKFYFFTTLLNQLYWIIGCTLGALIGQYVNFNAKGIEFVMTALFVVIFLEQWESQKDHRPALIGAATALAALVLSRLLFSNGADFFLIPSMLFILAFLSLYRNTFERRASL